MTKPDEICAMVKKTKAHFGSVDMLINCAGQGYDAPVEKINSETFHTIFDLDVMGAVLAMQEVIPIMRKQKKGMIINISSGTALMILPNMSAYASLKQALAKISLTAREELKNDHIIVSVVYPYITETKFEENTLRETYASTWNRKYQPPAADSAEFAAQTILDAIQSEEAETVAHEWMKK
jgi:short-subunit dehydrogenase